MDQSLLMPLIHTQYGGVFNTTVEMSERPAAVYCAANSLQQ